MKLVGAEIGRSSVSKHLPPIFYVVFYVLIRMIVRPPFVKNIPLIAVFWFGFLRFLQSRRDNISVENRLASCLVSSPARDGIDARKWGK